MKVKVESALDHRVKLLLSTIGPYSSAVKSVFIAPLPVSDQDIPVTASIALHTTVDIDFRRGGGLNKTKMVMLIRVGSIIHV